MKPNQPVSLISDAELVADAAVRLGKLKDQALLSSISAAKRAVDDESRVNAFRALQAALTNALRLLDPITLAHSLDSWGLRQ